MWVALSAPPPSSSPSLTLPFLLPYLELRRLGFGARDLERSASRSPPTSSATGRRRRVAAVGQPDPRVSEVGRRPVSRRSPRSLLGGRRARRPACRSAWATRTNPAGGRVAGSMPIVYVARRGGRAFTRCFSLLILTGNGFTRIGPLPISVRNLWRNSRVLAVIRRIAARRLAARAIVRAPVDRQP